MLQILTGQFTGPSGHGPDLPLSGERKQAHPLMAGMDHDFDGMFHAQPVTQKAEEPTVRSDEAFRSDPENPDALISRIDRAVRNLDRDMGEKMVTQAPGGLSTDTDLPASESDFVSQTADGRAVYALEKPDGMSEFVPGESLFNGKRPRIADETFSSTSRILSGDHGARHAGNNAQPPGDRSTPMSAFEWVMTGSRSGGFGPPRAVEGDTANGGVHDQVTPRPNPWRSNVGMEAVTPRPNPLPHDDGTALVTPRPNSADLENTPVTPRTQPPALISFPGPGLGQDRITGGAIFVPSDSMARVRYAGVSNALTPFAETSINASGTDASISLMAERARVTTMKGHVAPTTSDNGTTVERSTASGRNMPDPDDATSAFAPPSRTGTATKAGATLSSFSPLATEFRDRLSLYIAQPATVDPGPEPLSDFRSLVESGAASRPLGDPDKAQGDLSRQVSRQIVEAIRRTGARQTELLMNPVELGRVKITLQTTETGVTVHILADRPETLDLIRRHAELLAREFRDLGYQEASLSFAEEQGASLDSDRGEGGENLSDSAASDLELARAGEIDDAVSQPVLGPSDRLDIRI